MTAQITQVIDAITPSPDIADPSTFETRANTLLTAKLPTMVGQMNAWASQANTMSATMEGYYNTWVGAYDFAFRFYPGAYSVAPVTRPDGSARQLGDRYYNSVDHLTYTWGGSTWIASDINTGNLAATGGSALVGYDGVTAQDVFDSARPLASYAALQAYTGRAPSVRITAKGVSGYFWRDDSDTTTASNGGTVLVDGSGRRWKRIFAGDVHLAWFQPDTTGATVANAALQSALAAAIAAGGAVQVCDGTFLLDAISSPVTLYDLAHLEMRPKTTLQIKANNSAAAYGGLTIAGSNVVIRGGKIIGDRQLHDYSSGGTHEQSGCILINPTTASISNILIDNVWMIDGTGDGVLMVGINSGGNYFGPSKTVIQNCRIEDCRRQGISVVLGDDTKIVNNTIKNIGVTKYGKAGTAPMAGIDIEGGSCPRRTLISGNYFEGCLGGSVLTYNGNGVRIVGNHCVDYGILYQVSANVVIANNVLRNNGVASQGIEQSTGTIGVVGSGTQLAVGSKYSIVAQATLDFTSVGAAANTVGTVFIATAIGPLGSGDQVQRIAENVLIEGNQIYGAPQGISTSGYTANVAIVGNHLYGQTSKGIYIGNLGAVATVGGEKVTANALFNQVTGIQVSGGGVCAITNNSFDTDSSRAILCAGSSGGGLIKGNDIKAHGHAINAAIDVGGAAPWEVSGNHIRMNHPTVTGAYAIQVTTADTKVADNVITGACATAGIRVTQRAKLMSNKLVALDAPDGILGNNANAASSIVVNNYVESVKTSGSRYAIRFTSGGTGVRIIGNNVNNSAGTFTNSIATTGNTSSVVAQNVYSGGALANDASDTVSGNVSI